MEQNTLFPPLILYAPGEGRPIRVIGDCYRVCKAGSADLRTAETLCGAIRQLVSLATALGFEGNAWQSCLTFHLLSHKNSYSLSCEGRGDVGGSLAELARADLDALLSLFRFDFSIFEEALGVTAGRQLLHFRGAPRGEDSVGVLVDKVRDLLAGAPDSAAALAILADFYRDYGVGDLAFYRAFRMDDQGALVPIKAAKPFSLQDLVGYAAQKAELTANTVAFLAGKPANNVLLYGDAGTGKSTCVRSLLTDYRDSALRIVELTKPQLERLALLIGKLKERNYRFIIFIDDLSFEEHETGYKHLKAVIEGGLETMPENIRVYATSNRRHLIKETWKDKDDMEHDGDIHRSDTTEEKLSLAERFGIAINFPSPVRREYHKIVRALAAKQLHYAITDEDLIAGADRWEIRHGGISGRTAQQYIDYLAGLQKALNT